MRRPFHVLPLSTDPPDVPPRVRDGCAESVRVGAHRRNLVRFLGALGGSTDDAEDLAQEALVRWLRSATAPRADDDHGVRRWLFTVARRLFVDRYHRGRREMEVWSEQVEQHLLARWQGDRGDVWVDAAQRCVGQLPARTRRIVERFYRDGWSREAIAREFGMKENGVKTALQRARAALRQCIEEKTR